ncbi:MAG: DNA translocase FtsK [Pseudomonadota bacterium]
MAYPARGRDPLLDTATQAIIEKRGREGAGLTLLCLGLFFAVTLQTYSAADTSLMAAGASVHNVMGGLGAKLAEPFMKLLGYGTWALPVLMLGWGVRMMLHSGTERLIRRVMYAPLVVALASVYAATLMPSADWVHSFSMGGRFGDTVLFLILQVMPGTAALGAKILGLIVGLVLIALTLYVLGVTATELRMMLSKASWFIAVGLAAIVGFVAQRRGPRLAPATAMPADDTRQRVADVIRANPVMPTGRVPAAPVEDAPASLETQSLFQRMPSLLKRPTAEPAPIQTQSVQSTDVGVQPPDRIRAKISDAIRLRARPPSVIQKPVEEAAPKFEPSLTRSLDPADGPLDLRLPVPPVASALPTAPQMPPVAPSNVAQHTVGQSMAAHPMPVAPSPILAPAEDNIFADDDDTVMMAADTVGQPVPFTMDPLPVTPMPATPAAVPPMPATAPVSQDTQKSVVQHPVRKAVQPSRQAQAEAQPALALEPKPKVHFEAPPLSLLMNPTRVQRHVLSDEALEQNARMLESVLDDYGIKGEIVSVRPGPVVTMYELEPAPGLKASRVIGLSDDIARSMSALSARVSTVPGRSVIGIELPNENREMVALREMLSTRDFGDSSMKLPLALGKDIGGEPIIANLAKMPHLLIAGTTGSGKSVAINTMILSLLYRLSPEECRLIMIDPKMLELSVYDGIPHLLSPVVTDPKKAVVALKWVVGEMEDRYRKMSKMGVRNIDGYNSRVADAMSKGELFSRTVQTGFDDNTGEPIFETEEFAPEKLPYIVVIVDEMADLMMVAGKEIEACIQRLAQMARASGIHLIMATQRPSVDVITGTIKANFPTRISFQVTSKVDSRTILGEMGAEQLLGQGDMLYMAGGGKITRVHGPFCSDEEVEEIVNYLKTFGPPEYVGGVVDGPNDEKGPDIDAVLGLGGNTDQEDALYDTAVQIVIKDRKCSTSYIQRKLAIGYNKAARLVEQMEDNGLVSPANHVGKREILVPEQG